MLKNIMSHPLFWAGTIFRVILFFSFTQKVFLESFGPFLARSMVSLSLDPWSDWLETKENLEAFPYGYVMWASLAPLQAPFVGFGQAGPQIGYFLTLFFFDFLLLFLLARLTTRRFTFVLLTYWISPIVFISTYVLGYNDVVPAFFLLLAIYLIKQNRFAWAGISIGAAISAKLSMVVALPLFLIFLMSRKYREVLPNFLGGFSIFLAVVVVPYLLSEGARAMLFGNPAVLHVFVWRVDSGLGAAILVIPLLYLIVIYSTWRIRRLNFDMFQSSIGVIFLGIVLTSPSSFGWFLWVMPFLVLYQAKSSRITGTGIWVFSILYVASALNSAAVTLSNGNELRVLDYFQLDKNTEFIVGSGLHTLVVAAGIILMARIWREMLLQSNYFRSSRKPFAIGIAGDSGAGKDTFAEALGGVLGPSLVAPISGDDYHLWDRQKPMWQVMTHLNPASNDLERLWKDLSSLMDGRPIMATHYNHVTGKTDPPLKVNSRDFIVCSGLHAFFSPSLSSLYDLKIYLDIDEGLRRHFKIQRDTSYRGQSVNEILKAIERRIPDSHKFVRPQLDVADLIFSIKPAQPISEPVDSFQPTPRLRLVVSARDGTQIESLRRVLVGVSGLGVDSSTEQGGLFTDLSVEGEIATEAIVQAAQILCPEMSDYLRLRPQWLGGPLGLMQLVTIHHMNLAFTRRLLL